MSVNGVERRASLDMAHRRFEQAQPEGALGRRVAALARVLAGQRRGSPGAASARARRRSRRTRRRCRRPSRSGCRRRSAGRPGRRRRGRRGRGGRSGPRRGRSGSAPRRRGRRSRCSGCRARRRARPSGSRSGRRVVAEGAGQQAGAGQHLEAVADADDRAAAGDEVAQPLAEAAAVGQREVEGQHAAGAEGVAVAEPAGDDDDARRVEQLGPGRQLGGQHDGRLGPGQVERQHGVGVAVGPRPGDHDAPSAGSRATDAASDGEHQASAPWKAAARVGDGDWGDAGEARARARR